MFQIPANQTTMIGSMPHQDIDSAIELLKRFPLDIPTWPQLPKRSFKEGMMPQYCEGFPGIKIDEEERRIWLERNDELLSEMAVFFEYVLSDAIEKFSISSEYATGFHPFIDFLKGQNEKLAIVKGQVTGPFTYGLSINDNDKKSLWFDEQYKDVILQGLAKKAIWQVGKLKEYAENVIIFFDEPIFSALGTPAYIGIQDEEVVSTLNEMAEPIHATGAAVGVHCCGNMDWSLLAQSSIDIIAFDAYGYGDKLGLYPEAIDKFLARGGVLAWGIVPTGNPEDIHKETSESLKSKIEALMESYVKKGVSEDRLRNQLIYTPSCGMGTLTTDDAETVLRLLLEVGAG